MVIHHKVAVSTDVSLFVISRFFLRVAYRLLSCENSLVYPQDQGFSCKDLAPLTVYAGIGSHINSDLAKDFATCQTEGKIVFHIKKATAGDDLIKYREEAN